MTCTRHPFNDPDVPLTCVRTGEHALHEYRSSAGSELGEGPGHMEPKEDVQ